MIIIRKSYSGLFKIIEILTNYLLTIQFIPSCKSDYILIIRNIEK